MTENLKTKAYNHIRQGLLLGQWPEGTFFSTGKVAKLIGMSYTPVREAIIQLESEGLVETVTNQGIRTKTLNRDELQEKFELRVILESGAAKLAAEKISEGELDGLRKLAGSISFIFGHFVMRSCQVPIKVLSFPGRATGRSIRSMFIYTWGLCRPAAIGS